MDRRRFIRTSLATSVASLVAPRLSIPAWGRDITPRKILVLGGTNFLGPAVVEAAVVGGHRVTLFNRGSTHPELVPRLEKLRGFLSPDPADENVSSLGQRQWDVVVDVW